MKREDKTARVVRWPKLGEPEVVLEEYGKRVVRQQFMNPRTEEADTFLLFGQRDWSVVLPITDDGRVVVVEQYKQGCDDIVVELPAGTADFVGEDPQGVVSRELREETGYEPGTVVPLGVPQFMATRNSWTRFFPFLALGCRKVATPLDDPNETLLTRLMPLDEWIDLALTDLVEPSAVVATFRALRHLDYRIQPSSRPGVRADRHEPC